MIWFVAALLIGVIAITLFYLRGENLRTFDSPRPSARGLRGQPSEQHGAVVESLSGLGEMTRGVSQRAQLPLMREYLDSMGQDVSFDGEITPLDADGIKGEWVVAAGGDPQRRMLYIHGGAWIMGSPLSHRAITTHYAKLIGGAVFSLDYRLMPENSRLDGIDDCRSAWRWIVEHGPAGAATASALFVSGDSAGGNLTLSLIAWIRDQGLRAPNAAVALSPATDGTFTSPSMRANVATDHMLGPQFGKLNRIPKWILQWGAWWASRIRPSHACVSPVFDNLSGLPPTLIHASAAEMLLDDAVRYANKARAQGSPVDLQTWEDMVHVWHIFVADLPEAQQAFVEIDAFLKTHGGAVDGVQAA
jgi:monoterpene epsilon-lactone hydrolase